MLCTRNYFMSKKKVLVFNLTTRGGMLHYSSQFCNELAKTHQVTAVVASYYTWTLYDDIVTLFKIRTNPSLWSFVLDSLLFWHHISLLLKIKKYKPDIVHIMDNHPWYPFYVRLCRRMWYTIYVTQHDPILHSGETQTLLGKVAAWVNTVLRRRSDKLIVHGDKLKEEVISMYKFPSDKIVSVPHGNYTFFTKWAKWAKPKKNHFLFFGRILAYKWLDVLLASLALVKERIPDFVLIIAGNGDLTSYDPLLATYKDNIALYHYDIPEDEVYLYFEQSAFVVLPYKDATWSGIIPVAYAFGKPVITTNVGELSTHVQAGETWFVVEPNNPQQLAEKIILLLEDTTLVTTLWAHAFSYAQSHLSWTPIVDKIYWAS